MYLSYTAEDTQVARSREKKLLSCLPDIHILSIEDATAGEVMVVERTLPLQKCHLEVIIITKHSGK